MIEEDLSNFDSVVEKYTPLLKSLIKKYLNMNSSNVSIEYEDLMQECLIGVYDTVRTFDSSKGVYFSHYLRLIVNNKLLAFCRDYLPHIYKKNRDKSSMKGRPVFDRIPIYLNSWDDYCTTHSEN